MIDDGDCAAIGGMKTGRGNRSTRRRYDVVSANTVKVVSECDTPELTC
jgi:hypothetical protein